jgi:hypothetical protein
LTVAVSLLNGPDPPPHFKTADSFIWFLILTINMLLACFTLHKVQVLKWFGLRRKEDITWLSLKACDPPELGWRDTGG